MAGFIGNTPAEKYVSLETQNFTVTATANYTLSNAVTNENEIALFINNVRQQPGSSYAYTASGTTLTLSSATAGTDTMYCVYLGKSVGTINPPDGSVGTAKIEDSAVTDAKISGLSSSKLTGALPAISGASLTNLPSEITKQGSDPTISTNPSGGVGSIILNTSSGKMFVCTDSTAGANVWKAGVDGEVAPFSPTTATGGTVTTDGDYKVHTFTSSGNFVVSASGQPVEYLVIAGGGGGGGYYYCGGGGAGGYLTATGFSVSNQTYAIVVGAGGAGGPNATIQTGGDGSTSTFATISPVGGGGGAKSWGFNGNNGGSGGGASGSGGTDYDGGSGTAGQGNDGATSKTVGSNLSGSGGGGGGGAGSAAIDRTSTSDDAKGGNGLSSSITGTAVVRAGGGGGGVNSNSVNCDGGTGGGGQGSNNSQVAGDGSVNTGSGGGGADANGNASAGGNGGSGIVILRYKFQ